jgi:hypothetical protein
MTAIAMPITPSTLKASPNISHAISAVVGGVRYSRLVTTVASLRRSSVNS